MSVEFAKQPAVKDRLGAHAWQVWVPHRADTFMRHELTSVPRHVSADGLDALIPPQLRTVAAKGGAATSGRDADSASGSQSGHAIQQAWVLISYLPSQDF